MKETIQDIVDVLPASANGWTINELENYIMMNFNLSTNATQAVVESLFFNSVSEDPMIDVLEIFKHFLNSLVSMISGNPVDSMSRMADFNRTVLFPNNTDSCSPKKREELFEFWFVLSFIPSGFFFLVFIFLQRRKRACLQCCKGVPGIAYPVNVIDAQPDRLGYACAFGATTVCVLGLFSGSYLFDYDLSQVHVALRGTILIVLKMINVIFIGLVYLPMFLSLTTDIRIIGNCIGIIYTGGWTVFYLYDFIKCQGKYEEIDLVVVLVRGPNILCLLILSVRYLLGFIQNVGSLVCNKSSKTFWINAIDYKDGHHYTYVKHLLYPKSKPTKCKCWNKLRSYLYQNKPGFKYSTRIVCTIVVAGVVLLQLSTVWTAIFGYLFKQLLFYLTDNRVKLAFELTNHTAVYHNIVELVKVVSGTFDFSSKFVTTLHYVFLFHMLACYRQHMLALFRGDKSFPKIPLGNPNAVALAGH
ncbi:stimulated by retinoic acid gene 6 protein-like [Saccoglossus kowalevskii]